MHTYLAPNQVNHENAHTANAFHMDAGIVISGKDEVISAQKATIQNLQATIETLQRYISQMEGKTVSL